VRRGPVGDGAEVLPTPTAHDGSSNGISATTRRGGPSLLDQLRLFPTPTAISPNDGEDTTHWLARQARHRARRVNGNGMGIPLSIAVRLLPTPTAGDSHSSAIQTVRNSGRPIPAGSTTLTDSVRMLPTPIASDARTCTRRTQRGGPSLSDMTRLLPSPRATDGTKGSPAQRGSKGDLMLPSAIIRLLTTPAGNQTGDTGIDGTS
jgi:DNA (cytosine-5)-methyltransferase 1